MMMMMMMMHSIHASFAIAKKFKSVSPVRKVREMVLWDFAVSLLAGTTLSRARCSEMPRKK